MLKTVALLNICVETMVILEPLKVLYYLLIYFIYNKINQ